MPPGAKSETPTEVIETEKGLSLTLDLDAYLNQLEDWEISNEQKTEFILTLWKLMVSFAEIGFGIHPAQTANSTGRKSLKTPENLSVSAPDMLYSPHIKRIQNNADLGAVIDGQSAEISGEETPS